MNAKQHNEGHGEQKELKAMNWRDGGEEENEQKKLLML